MELVPDALKQSSIPKRVLSKRCGVLATPDSGQLVKGEIRLLDRVTGDTVSGSCELVPGCTHSQKSLKQPGWMTLKVLVGWGQGFKQKTKWQASVFYERRCQGRNDLGGVFNYFPYFSSFQGLENWDIFSLDVNSTFWGPKFVFTLELTNNTCFPPGILWVLNIEEEGLASLIEEVIGLWS